MPIDPFIGRTIGQDSQNENKSESKNKREKERPNALVVDGGIDPVCFPPKTCPHSIIFDTGLVANIPSTASIETMAIRSKNFDNDCFCDDHYHHTLWSCS